MNIFYASPLTYLLRAAAVLLTILLHYAAAWLALSALGFDKRRESGAIKHIDPLGALLLFFMGFGWANPLPGPAVYPVNKRNRLICARVFPLAVNLVAGICAAAMCGFAYRALPSLRWVGDTLGLFANVSVGFAVFNIIPIPPLDGAEVLNLVMRPNSRLSYSNMEWVLQALLVIALVSNFTGKVLSPIIGGIIGVFA